MSTEQLPIKINACELTRNSATFSPGLQWAEWMDAGQQLCRVAGATLWWIGDWVNYGEASYGEKYKHALNVTGYDIQTLMDAAWVARSVQISFRKEGLTYSHHREVAQFAPKEQERWLNMAATNLWTVSQLRQAIRQHNAVFKDDEPNPGLFKWAASAQEVERHLLAEERKLPIEKWPGAKRQAAIELIQPLHKFYERLAAVEA